MISVHETTRTLPFFRPVPLTSLPLLYHREHLFPYTSYGHTEPVAVPRDFRILVLENEFLRVEIAPELGGRVYSLYDKAIRREILFRNPVVKPVRILPVWAFISGGIEFNFPIAHSPTSIAEVGCASGQRGHYAFVRVGEREARTGMEWTVELGLLEHQPLLIQRTALRNHSGADHPWMLWTIAAVRSTPDTEFIHPPHRVLVHDHRLAELDWPGDGLNWERNYHRMTALFWKPGSAPHFGAFHHDLGCGLMHLASPDQLPGKKIWTYGHGPHRSWGRATTRGHLSYAEIESGPLLDQAQKTLFPNGSQCSFEEFWIPVHSRKACDTINFPALDLPPFHDPWLGWRHSAWQTQWEAFNVGDAPLPDSVVPTGINLEAALRRELHRGNLLASQPLALWLAFHNRPDEALPLVQDHPSPHARRIAGLILWKALHKPPAALAHLEAGPLEDPVATLELDQLYAELDLTPKRQSLLALAPNDPLLLERKAHLALVTGHPEQTLSLLTSTRWPRQHQRYVRSDLWRQANAALGNPDSAVPEFLNEDNLAPFGAYWSD